MLPNGYRPETLWLKKHVDRNELALKELEAQKDICEIEFARSAGIVTVELAIVARAVDPSVAATIVAAAQNGGSRGGGSRPHNRESAPRRRRDHSPDSDGRGRRSRSRP